MTSSQITADKDFNVFVGSDIGVFKGINVNQKCSLSKNFEKLSSLTKESCITCLSYGENESEVLIGTRGQMVKVFNVGDKCYSSQKDVSTRPGSGPIVGLARYKDALVTANESGDVKFWAFGAEKTFNPIDAEVYSMGKLGVSEKSDQMTQEQREKHAENLKIGRKLCRMRQCPDSRNLVAMGGKEVDLQVWDIDKPEEPIFRAKNVKPDFLQLRVPVWISDLTFLSPDTVATCSRHGHIRLYKVNGTQRRPVRELCWREKDDDLNCTAICKVNENQVLVGTATGKLGLWDFTPNAGFKGLVRKFKGCVGAVKSIHFAANKGFFGAVGLDRFLRVYSIKDMKPVHSMYLKTKLTSILLASNFDLDPHQQTAKDPEGQEDIPADDDLVEADEGADGDDDSDIEIIEEEEPEKFEVAVADTKLENLLALPDHVYKDKTHAFFEFFSTSKKARKVLKTTEDDIEREKALNKIRKQFENFQAAHSAGHFGPSAAKKQKIDT